MRRAAFILASVLTAAIAAGCGGGSSNSGTSATGSAAAHRLLVQTFSGHHTIKSGVLRLEVRITPSGSRTLTKPLGLSLSGPFTTAGGSSTPESDFTIAIFAQGHRGALQLISAGGKGYITVSGQSYQMPASSFKNLGSGFGSLATTGGSSSSKSSALSKLGIRPLQWLEQPRIVGNATVGGDRTTMIAARVNPTQLLSDLSKVLGTAGSRAVAGSAGATLPSSISAAVQRQIAKAIGTPTLTVWTGSRDRIVRRLTLAATIPVTGRTRTQLGGMTAAHLTVDFQYDQLNRPQKIVAPARLAPYSAFRARVDTLLSEVEGGIGSTNLGGTTTGSSTGASPDQRYRHCITAAKGDVSKMQKCASLLGGS